MNFLIFQYKIIKIFVLYKFAFDESMENFTMMEDTSLKEA